MSEEFKKRGSLSWSEPLIFEKSAVGHPGYQLVKAEPKVKAEEIIPGKLLRKTPAELPEIGEPEVIRHYSRLSSWNYSVDHGFYPLGSCTMKYNPKLNEFNAMLAGFSGLHPESLEETSRG
ncbi:MAG: hypothetical protein NC828_01640 [Candidatus Omnitrophica bacterium]|nr:hypothetical protein [Candidatus Omnitrophota bacterium]